MADDERRSETFIREVDEELRRDQLKSLWMRFAPLIIGVCVLVVALTAGYRGWIWWHERQAAQAGDRFLAAIEQIESGKRAEGEAALQAIATEGGAGYAALARLRLAGEKAGEGAKADAIAAFDTLANDSSVSEPLRDMARIRAALLALDTGDLEGAKTRAAAAQRRRQSLAARGARSAWDRGLQGGRPQGGARCVLRDPGGRPDAAGPLDTLRPDDLADRRADGSARGSGRGSRARSA